MSVNQLLAKALSTPSEEEAMSCLRMARKKGGRLEDSGSSSKYNGQSAEYWYNKASMYYAKSREKQAGLTIAQQEHLWKMYKDESGFVSQLRGEKQLLEEELRKIKSQALKGAWKIPLIIVQLIVIGMMLTQLIG